MGTQRPRKDEIFHATVELTDAEERAAYLEEACGDDATLKAEMLALLAHDGAADSFLDRDVAAVASSARYAALGTQIGPYKLLQRIGEGGMGVVYMAEQAKPVSRRGCELFRRARARARVRAPARSSAPEDAGFRQDVAVRFNWRIAMLKRLGVPSRAGARARAWARMELGSLIARGPRPWFLD